MIIYYTEGLKKILNDPSRYIKISKFKLGESRAVSSIEELEDSWDKGTSPTIGEYDLEGIYKNSCLTLSIKIPSYDVSLSDIDAYDIIYVLYEDLTLRSEENSLKLAFILSGNINSTENGLLEFMPLYLEPERTIINIKDFNFRCSIKLGQDSDLEFLEGIGLDSPKNIYTNEEINNEDIRYVSRESYETYLQEVRDQDEYKHLDTAFINKYGLKIY